MRKQKLSDISSAEKSSEGSSSSSSSSRSSIKSSSSSIDEALNDIAEINEVDISEFANFSQFKNTLGEKKNEMMEYYVLCYMDSRYSNYKVDDEYYHQEKKKENEKLAKLIHDDFNKMTNEEMKHFVIKCFSPAKIKQELLKFELEHYVPEKIGTNITEIDNEIKKILCRYQSKAGGFCLEDHKWICHPPKTHKKKITLTYENSLGTKDFDNNMGGLVSFLKKIIEKISLLNDNLDVFYNIAEPNKDDIGKVLIICYLKN